MNVREIIRSRQKLGLDLRNIPEDEWKSRRLDLIIEKDLVEEIRNSKGRILGNLDENYIKKLLEEPFVNPINLPTDLQRASEYMLVSKLLSKTLSTAEKLSMWNGEKPTIATELGKDINGYCFEAGENEVGIVLDSTLLVFAHLLAKLLAPVIFEISKDGLLTIANQKEIQNKISIDSEFYYRFTDLFTSYMEEGWTSRAAPYLLDSKYDSCVTALREGMELFIVAHECGHIYHKHLKDKWMKGGNDLSKLTQMVDENKPAFLYRQHKELEADLFGYSIVFNAAQSEQNPLLAIGPIVYFIAIEILERFLFFGLMQRDLWCNYNDAIGSLISQYIIPSTHPKPARRNNYIIRALQRMKLPIQIIGQIEHIRTIVSNFLLSAEKLWQEQVVDAKRSISVNRRWDIYKEEFNSYNLIAKNIMDKMKENSNNEINNNNTVFKGNTFEKKVFDLLSAELNNENLFITPKTSQIFAKKPYYSRDRSANIIVDISIETSIPGASHYSLLTLIECKNYSHAIPVDDIEEFHSKVQQLSGDNVKAIFITNSALQKAALSYAQAKNIGIIRLLPDDQIKWIIYHINDDAINLLSRPNIKEFTSAFLEQNHESLNKSFYGLANNYIFSDFTSLLKHMLNN